MSGFSMSLIADWIKRDQKSQLKHDEIVPRILIEIWLKIAGSRVWTELDTKPQSEFTTPY